MADNETQYYKSNFPENDDFHSDIESPMEADPLERCTIKPSDSLTSLQLMLTSIQHERTKEHSDLKLISSDGKYSIKGCILKPTLGDTHFAHYGCDFSTYCYLYNCG